MAARGTYEFLFKLKEMFCTIIQHFIDQHFIEFCSQKWSFLSCSVFGFKIQVKSCVTFKVQVP